MHTTPAHPSDVTTPDLSAYRAGHEAIRATGRKLVQGLTEAPLDDQRRVRALARWFRGVRAELELHHRAEDTLYFPALAERVPTYAVHAADVDRDHHHLDVLITRVTTHLDEMVTTSAPQARDAAVAAARELSELLVDHLDFEDADLLPLFERHFTAEEYQQLERRMLKAVPLSHAFFTVPWFIASVPADVAVRTLAEAPMALSIVHRISRRRYARLVNRAFGA